MFLFVSCKLFGFKVYILSHISIATCVLFSLLFARNIFLFESVYMDFRWTCCREHIVGLYSFICSVNLCLLIGEFTTFTFKIITAKERFNSVSVLFIFYMPSSFGPHVSCLTVLYVELTFCSELFLCNFLLYLYSKAIFCVVTMRITKLITL